MAETGTLDADHRALKDDLLSRRYFTALARVMDTLPPVLAEMIRDRILTHTETEILSGYVRALTGSVSALSMKYLVSGRIEGPLKRHLTIDIHESGWPVWSEIAQMAADAAQAEEELARTPTADAIKDDMVRQIVGDLSIPTRLQYALSQRLYYRDLARGLLFWPQMHPTAYWLTEPDGGRRRWLIHWAVYDSQLNVPVIYLMDADETGRRPLGEDSKRWPELRAHLLAQSVGGLQLVTIAQGVDHDFDDVHPYRLRRITLGPLYAEGYTVQEGPIREVLESAHAPAGENWAMAATIEDLQSDRAVMESTGFFSVTERQIWRLDPLNQHGAGQGATGAERFLILPARPYQALAELDPAGFRRIRKYVPGPDGRVAAYW